MEGEEVFHYLTTMLNELDKLEADQVRCRSIIFWANIEVVLNLIYKRKFSGRERPKNRDDWLDELKGTDFIDDKLIPDIKIIAKIRNDLMAHKADVNSSEIKSKFEDLINQLKILETWEGSKKWSTEKKFSRACHRIFSRVIETYRLVCNPKWRGQTYYGSI